MTTEASQITAANGPLKLGENEFECYPLTDKDYSELDEYIRAAFVRIATMATEDLPEAMQRVVISQAMKDMGDLHWFEGDGKKLLNTHNGMARLAWQMTKKNHNMDFDTFREHVEYNRDSREITLTYARMNLPEKFAQLTAANEENDEDNNDEGSKKGN